MQYNKKPRHSSLPGLLSLAKSEHALSARVETASAAEAGNLSHEITSLAAASSAHPLREARLASRSRVSRETLFTISRFRDAKQLVVAFWVR